MKIINHQINAIIYRRIILHKRSWIKIVSGLFFAILSSLSVVFLGSKDFNDLSNLDIYTKKKNSIAIIASPDLLIKKMTKMIVNNSEYIMKNDFGIKPMFFYFYSISNFNNWVYNINLNDSKLNVNLLYGIYIHNNSDNLHLSLTYLYNSSSIKDQKIFSQVIRNIWKVINSDNSCDFTYDIKKLPNSASKSFTEEVLPYTITISLINICILFVTQIIEDVSSEKRKYMTVCSLEIINYWIGSFLVDFLEWILIISCFWIVFLFSNISIFSIYLGKMFLSLIFSGPGFILFSYSISFIFKSPETGSNYAILLMLALLIFFSIPDLTENPKFNKLITLIGLLYPPSNLCYILQNIIEMSITSIFSSTFIDTTLFLLFLFFIEWTLTLDNSTSKTSKRKMKLKTEQNSLIDQASVLKMENIVNHSDCNNIFALHFHNVSKIFRAQSETVVAINNLTLGIKKNSTFGLLGPNGSGKTTLIKLILNQISADSGSIIRNGNVSYCPQNDDHLTSELTGFENLKFYGTLFGMKKSDIEYNIKQLALTLDLNTFLHKKIYEMSGGTKRKISIAISFLYDKNPIIILDEPTSSLDSMSRDKVLNLIHKQKYQRTIIHCTHLLDEVDTLFDEMIILSNGSISAIGSPIELTQRLVAYWKIDIYLQESNCENKIQLQHFMRQNFKECRLIFDRQTTQVYSVPISTVSQHDIFSILKTAKYQIPSFLHFTCASATLENVFSDFIKKSDI